MILLELGIKSVFDVGVLTSTRSNFINQFRHIFSFICLESIMSKMFYIRHFICFLFILLKFCSSEIITVNLTLMIIHAKNGFVQISKKLKNGLCILSRFQNNEYCLVS